MITLVIHYQTTMVYPQIRLNKTKDIQTVLDYLKKRFKLFNESDILKLVLSQAYFVYKSQEDLNEFKKRAEWEITLPSMKLTTIEQKSIEKNLKNGGKIMTINEMKAISK